MDVSKKDIRIHETKNGKRPFDDWLYGLKDAKTRTRIVARLDRIQEGNYGDCKYLANGVYELRLFFGAGYRVYFGEIGDQIILLLCGGDKSDQKKDIAKALEYWKEVSYGK